MKRTLTTATLMTACASAFIVFASFKTIGTDALKTYGKKAMMLKKEPVTFFAHNPVLLHDGTTFTGTVTAEGAINATGTNIMYTEVLGMALHCTILMTFPVGTLTIRMNCNMKTLNGRWKILEGTGTYANMKGEGSLVMPNDVDEVMTGFIH